MSSRDVSELAGYLGCGSLAIAERVNSSDWVIGKLSNWAIEDFRFQVFRLRNYKILQLLNPLQSLHVDR
jgi:hypothetical protein